MDDRPKRKQNSGAKNRKRTKAVRESIGAPPTPDFAASSAAAAITKLGFPDLGDLTRGLTYARDCGLICLHEIVSDIGMDPVTRWRLVKDFIATLGMTHTRTAVEAKLEKVIASRKIKTDPLGGLQKFAGVTRPVNARQQSHTEAFGQKDRNEAK